MRGRLEAAYRATGYRCVVDGAALEIRIDALHPLLDRWLAQRGCRQWAWITAANPGSRPLAEVENARRQSGLLQQATAMGLPVLTGENVADAGDWPVEPSLLIAGVEVGAAIELARRWGQNALLVGESGGPARLVWVQDESG